MKFTSISLPKKIALFTLLLIGGGIVPLAFYTTFTLQSNLQNLLSMQQFTTVGYIAQDLEHKVNLRIQSLQDVAEHLPTDKLNDRDAINEYLNARIAIYRMFSNGVVVIGKDGFGIADHPHVENRDTSDYRELEYFKEVISTGKPAIGKPRIGQFTNKLGVGIAVPIQDQNGFLVGVIVGFIGLADASVFDQTKAKLGRTGEFVLVSVKDRIVIVDTDNSHILMPVNDLGVDLNFDRCMAGYEGTSITSHFHLGTALTSCRKLMGGRWLLLGVLPLEEAFEPVTALKKQVYVATTVFIVLIAPLIWWLVQHQLRPLTRATRLISSMDISGGRQLAIPVESDDEVGELVSTLNEMHHKLHASYIELQNKAHKDFLTGLFNRRHFMELAEQEIARSVRYASPLAAFMLDIDLFKKVNDTYGHKAGDLVLKKLAGIILEALREVDIAGRIGGEEFAILLPETDGHQALEVAERLRQLAENASIQLENGLPLKFTVSIGIATLVGKEMNIDTLLNQADQAMYQAKNSGRNKVIFEVQ